jgi:hypothetical protein
LLYIDIHAKDLYIHARGYKVSIKRGCLALILIVIVQISLFAQTHLSVPLGHPVYHIIENAQIRGLCGFLPNAKPYSQAQILSIIEEILNASENLSSGQLTQQERAVLNEYRRAFSPKETGLDMVRGAFFTDATWNDFYFSAEVGFGLDLGFSGAFYPFADGYKFSIDDNAKFEGANHPGSGDFFYGLDSRLNISLTGDLGRDLSYGFSISGGVFKSPRALLGAYNTYYDGFPDDEDDVGYARRNRLINSYNEPLAYFPYTYKKKWDGPLWFTTQVDNAGHKAWPDEISIGYSLIPELSGNLLNGHVLYRIARLDREWAGMTTNGSLVLNQSAQPFLAGEITFVPFPWLSFSSLTGVLEYSGILETSGSGNKSSAETFQNAFSINVLELNILNFFHIDIGSSAIWPKRFEIGYAFPLADNFLYQNNIGDFDNMALFLNIQGQFPGLGKIWASLFLDEMNPEGNFFEKSRQMYSFQFGGSVYIPWFTGLSFSSVTFSYTKVEPYTYTHTREQLPWYDNRLRMETNYVNNGKSLGHYIPPNSDEILVRFDTIPAPNSIIGFQYQLIRHGADYGDRAVGGSSLWSELDPNGRSDKPNLRKYFLHDGAYQWMHIFKFRGEYSFTGLKLPFKLFCEVGAVYSYFTDIDRSIEPNSGYSSPYNVVNGNPAYPHALSLIFVLGLKLFPKW